MDGGVLPDETDARAAALASLDATVGELQEARGEDSAVIVTGVSQVAEPNRLLATIANFGTDDGHNLLDLPAERPGYLRLTDLTATILTLLDAPLPDTVTGTGARATEDRCPMGIGRRSSTTPTPGSWPPTWPPPPPSGSRCSCSSP